MRCLETVAPIAAQRGLEVELSPELGEERQHDDGAALARALAGEPVVLCVHGGLSDAAFGVSQKKAETLVVDPKGRVAQRLRV